MPVHNWTKVTAGIFHHFHQPWIISISNALNNGVLPADCYALVEQIAGGVGPDVLTLQHPTDDDADAPDETTSGGLALQTMPPRARYHGRTEVDVYAAKASTIVVRHTGHDNVIAMIEIVSPGNKAGRRGVSDFIEKGEQMLRSGVHLLVIDLFPPRSFDPDGLPVLLWKQFGSEDKLELPPEHLTLAAYIGGTSAEAFIEPIEVGSTLPDMPLFLSTQRYVLVPLENTYRTAWDAVPATWQERLLRD